MDEILIQSFVAAPPERVWEQLLARPDLVLDALPLHAWPVERVEERPARLEVPWPGGAGRPATRVTITLAVTGPGTTRLEVRHGGWEAGAGSEDAIAGHFAGWLQAVAALGLLVETGRDPRATSPQLAQRERYFASGEIAAEADAVFRAITDPDVLARWAQGALDGAAPADAVAGRYVRWTTAWSGAEPGEAVMILRPTPRGTHCAVAEYGVTGRAASTRWPKLLERLAQFLR